MADEAQEFRSDLLALVGKSCSVGVRLTEANLLEIDCEIVTVREATFVGKQRQKDRSWSHITYPIAAVRFVNTPIEVEKPKLIQS